MRINKQKKGCANRIMRKSYNQEMYDAKIPFYDGVSELL